MSAEVKFNCPYCGKRFTRKDLCSHVERKHIDEIPEGFTPLRVAFHVANRKDFDYRPPCRVCKNDTEWDESKGRYNQLCVNPTCKERYIEKMKRDMGDKLGTNRPTATVEGLEKMLAARKISGKYKFKDGGEFAYTGSYEKSALEFLDKVMNIKSEDLIMPAPAMKYTLDGKQHIYIPDMYYAPYNLIIEVKDGGDNPNKNPQWKETRAKQIAKEEFVTKHTDFNYIRLTNNDFSQILAIFADLKMSLVDSRLNNKKPERVIHINESVPAGIPGAIPPCGSNDVVVVNYMRKPSFTSGSSFAVADNIRFDTLFAQAKDETLQEVSRDFLFDTDYNTYIVKNCKSRIFDKLEANKGKIVSNHFIYETVFGHKRYTEDQIKVEENCIPYEDYYSDLNNSSSAIKEYIMKD